MQQNQENPGTTKIQGPPGNQGTSKNPVNRETLNTPVPPENRGSPGILKILAILVMMRNLGNKATVQCLNGVRYPEKQKMVITCVLCKKSVNILIIWFDSTHPRRIHSNSPVLKNLIVTKGVPLLKVSAAEK